MLFIIYSIGFVAAQTSVCGIKFDNFDYVTQQLITIGEAGALLMIAIEGGKYIISTNPQERESARRGVIYIVIGLVLIRVALPLTLYLFCSN